MNLSDLTPSVGSHLGDRHHHPASDSRQSPRRNKLRRKKWRKQKTQTAAAEVATQRLHISSEYKVNVTTSTPHGARAADVVATSAPIGALSVSASSSSSGEMVAPMPKITVDLSDTERVR